MKKKIVILLAVLVLSALLLEAINLSVFAKYKDKHKQKRKKMGWFGNQDQATTAPLAIDASANRIYGSYYQCLEKGQATAIVLKLRNFEAFTPNIKCAIYRKSDGALIGYTEEKNISGKGAYTWVEFHIISGGTLVAGQDYYLVFWANDIITIPYGVHDHVADKGCRLNLAYDGFPDPLVGYTTEALQYCIYCTYQAAYEPPNVLARRESNESCSVSAPLHRVSSGGANVPLGISRLRVNHRITRLVPWVV